MALSKIRQANRKARRGHKRRQVRAEIAGTRHSTKIRRRRARKMMVQGRKEFNAKRRADAGYIKRLEAELADGE